MSLLAFLARHFVVSLFILWGVAAQLQAGVVLFVPNHDGGTATNGRVNRYDATSGEFVDVVVPAFPNDQIRGLTTEASSLYISVADAVNNTNGRVVRVDPFANAVTTFVVPESGGLFSPHELTFGPDGNLYVINNQPGVDEVLRFDGTTGDFIDVFASGLTIPQDLAFGPDGNLYVSNGGASTISRFDGSTGSSLGTFVPSGSGGLNGPHGIAFGADGNLYVASAFSDSVMRYDGATGAFLDTFVDSASGGLSVPIDLAFGPDGNLYVNSRSQLNTPGGVAGEILRFDGQTGDFIDSFVPPGSGNLGLPTGGLTFDPQPTAVVPEAGSFIAWTLAFGTIGLLTMRRRRKSQVFA
jgi:DNA-binding beta-propeller fold protein YncE